MVEAVGCGHGSYVLFQVALLDLSQLERLGSHLGMIDYFLHHNMEN